MNGYASAVNLTCGAGASPTCTVAPASVTPTVAGAPFTVTAKSTLAQIYNFSVNGAGTDGAHVAHSAPVVFNSLFTLTVTNSTGQQSLKAGQNAAYSLLVTPVGATTFPNAVNFSCSGLPVGATCSSSPIATRCQRDAERDADDQHSRPREFGDPAERAQNRKPWTPMVSVGVGDGDNGGRVGAEVASSRRAVGTAIAVLFASTLALTSCGGSGSTGGGGGPPAVSVSVSPHTA